MKRYSCPANCGKKFISEEHARNHAEKEHPQENLRRGWVTPYGFADFAKPVSYEDACEFMKRAQSFLRSKR